MAPRIRIVHSSSGPVVPSVKRKPSDPYRAMAVRLAHLARTRPQAYDGIVRLVEGYERLDRMWIDRFGIRQDGDRQEDHHK